ncbi:uncharacterized protein QC763_704150 [Podospora pseudopauciseta]|uniref:Uncharacterized protein n=2 Tax=Podospora TaxID=5144 RepID=A0ABY6SKV1_PODCO|nr:hypothetical protein QC763_704150 [Podospora pseudopauciseta]VBB86218.1 Putative protein of unknown function [Podospora comata]
MRTSSRWSLLRAILLLVALFITLSAAQTESAEPAPSSEPAAEPSTEAPSPSATPSSQTASPSTASSGGGGSGTPTTTTTPRPSGSNPPDVYLRVPELSVGRIELDVDDLKADVNLNAEIANLVSINVGVAVGIQKVNITISDVEAELELVIRLGHLVDIVNRTLSSLDLNPLLINLLNNVSDVVDSVVGAVDGLLGTITQGGSTLRFLIDNLGNIVQEVAGEGTDIVSSIVGNYQKNMTFTGVAKELGNGLTQRTYRYDALGSLVNIIFNTMGQVVQAVVVGKDNSGGGGGGGGSTTTAPASSAPATSVAPAPTTSAPAEEGE